MDIKQLIAEYLNEALLFQFATVKDNKPWVTTVCFGYDDKFNIYWFSKHSTRHSQELITNPNSAGTIVKSYSIGDKVRGLQFEGTIKELTAPEDIDRGLLSNTQRYHIPESRLAELSKELNEKSGDYGLYQFTPHTIILYDTVNFPDNPRQIYEVK